MLRHVIGFAAIVASFGYLAVVIWLGIRGGNVSEAERQVGEGRASVLPRRFPIIAQSRPLPDFNRRLLTAGWIMAALGIGFVTLDQAGILPRKRVTPLSPDEAYTLTLLSIMVVLGVIHLMRDRVAVRRSDRDRRSRMLLSGDFKVRVGGSIVATENGLTIDTEIGPLDGGWQDWRWSGPLRSGSLTSPVVGICVSCVAQPSVWIPLDPGIVEGQSELVAIIVARSRQDREALPAGRY